jgi:hypothetical protein
MRAYIPRKKLTNHPATGTFERALRTRTFAMVKRPKITTRTAY